MNSENPDSQSKLIQWLLHGNRPALLVLILLAAGILAVVVADNLPEKRMCLLFGDYQTSSAEKTHVLAVLGTTEFTDYCEENGQLKVREDQKINILAAISEKGAMPDGLLKREDSTLGPFATVQQQKQHSFAQKTQKVCEMIKQLPFVSDADLEFDRQESAELFRPEEQSAVVMITAKSNRFLDQQQLQSIQQTVASAFVAIAPDDVAIVDINAGIAYHDIEGQAHLIRLLNWKLKRSDHYQRLLSAELTPAFPGLEIAVQVHVSEHQFQQDDKLSRERVFKYAANQSGEPAQKLQPLRVGLNSTEKVTVHDHHIRQASHEATLPHAQRIITVPDDIKTELIEEQLNVTIVVPNSLLANLGTEESPELTPAEKFQQLSQQISTKVRAKIAPALLTDPLAIEIVPRQQLDSVCHKSASFSDYLQLQKYWPAWAVLLTSVLATILFRSQQRTEQADEPASVSDPNEANDLETKLSELIESDPATAAKVLKNWIQQDQ